MTSKSAAVGLVHAGDVPFKLPSDHLTALRSRVTEVFSQ